MATTISTVIVMSVIGLFLALSGYIIIAGDREESRQKKAKRAKKEARKAAHSNVILLP
jgi:uncharacterized membrane protein (DUF106 family)